jgi:hypothetical protein
MAAMIRLVRTQYLLDGSTFDLYSGKDDRSLGLIGQVEIRLRGSTGQGVCVIRDEAGQQIASVDVLIPEGSAETLAAKARDVVAAGFPGETVVVVVVAKPEAQNADNMRRMLATLPPRLELAMRLKYGIGEAPLDEAAIGERLGMTEDEVRQTIAAAIAAIEARVNAAT